MTVKGGVKLREAKATTLRRVLLAHSCAMGGEDVVGEVKGEGRRGGGRDYPPRATNQETNLFRFPPSAMLPWVLLVLAALGPAAGFQVGTHALRKPICLLRLVHIYGDLRTSLFPFVLERSWMAPTLNRTANTNALRCLPMCLFMQLGAGISLIHP